MKIRFSICSQLLGSSLLIIAISTLSNITKASAAPALEVTTLLKATHSWDGVKYQKYPGGQPEISILRYKIPAHTILPWHSHPVINAAYVISGNITVTTKGDESSIVIGPGDVLAETVGTLHRGETGDVPVELIVFYAGTPTLPLVLKATAN